MITEVAGIMMEEKDQQKQQNQVRIPELRESLYQSINLSREVQELRTSSIEDQAHNYFQRLPYQQKIETVAQDIKVRGVDGLPIYEKPYTALAQTYLADQQYQPQPPQYQSAQPRYQPMPSPRPSGPEPKRIFESNIEERTETKETEWKTKYEQEKENERQGKPKDPFALTPD
jgi:hypothetical protein